MSTDALTRAREALERALAYWEISSGPDAERTMAAVHGEVIAALDLLRQQQERAEMRLTRLAEAMGREPTDTLYVPRHHLLDIFTSSASLTVVVDAQAAEIERLRAALDALREAEEAQRWRRPGGAVGRRVDSAYYSGCAPGPRCSRSGIIQKNSRCSRRQISARGFPFRRYPRN